MWCENISLIHVQKYQFKLKSVHENINQFAYNVHCICTFSMIFALENYFLYYTENNFITTDYGFLFRKCAQSI